MIKTIGGWLALDKRIAKQVMGWREWDELPEDARKTYWQVTEQKPEEWILETFNRLMWWSIHESGCPFSEEDIKDWQPHESVAQALVALDMMVKRGFDADVKTRHYDSQHEVWIVPAECRGPCWLGVHDERRKAICLAIEHWMDAQKKNKNDRG